jgi:hypothetical protein
MGPSGLGAFAASVAGPGDLLRDPALTLEGFGLGLLFLIFALFPAVLFNKTLEEHYDEIAAWFRERAAWLPGLRASYGRLADFWGHGAGIVAFVVLSAIIYGFLMPRLGLDIASLAAILGILAGLVLVILAFDVPARRYHGLRTGDVGRLRVLPGSIAIGVVCVLVSRAIDFQPGYLYGLVVGYQFHSEMSGEHEGRSAALRAGWALGVSLVAWLALALLSPGTSSGGSLIALALGTMLATVVVAGIEGALFELFPMRFLPGEKVFGWRRSVWAVLFGISALAFVAVLINPASGYLGSTHQVPLLLALSLFIVFALVSVGFWAWFRYRPARPARPVMARKLEPLPAASRQAKRTGLTKGSGVTRGRRRTP